MLRKTLIRPFPNESFWVVLVRDVLSVSATGCPNAYWEV